MLIPPEVLLLLRKVFYILGFLLFQMNLSIALWRIELEFWWGIALNLLIAIGEIAIFTMLILPIHKHGRPFHFLRSSFIYFFRDLKFLSYRSFTCLVRVTSTYFTLFIAIVKTVVSLISFSGHLFFTDFYEQILYPTTLLKNFCQL